jgi:hypothetical protein
MMNVPVLCIVFNRPRETQILVDTLLKANVGPIYFSCGGPRGEQDEDSVNAVRSIITDAPWTVDIRTRFQDKNLGCRRNIIDAIDWILSIHDFAIILEDDVIPEPSFFPYCIEMSQRFSNENSIMMITGLNELGHYSPRGGSYFCTTGGTWGWGTWARAWELMDRDFRILDKEGAAENLSWYRTHIPRQVNRVLKGYEATKRGLVDTWDYEWALTRMSLRGFSIAPASNLISNIGTGKNATHTRKLTALTPPTAPLTFPLVHTPINQPEWEYLLNVEAKNHKNIVQQNLNMLRLRIRKLV